MEKSRALPTRRKTPAQLDRQLSAAMATYLLATSGYTPYQSLLNELGLKEIIMDENKPIEQSEEELELDILAEELTTILAKTSETFMLSAPMTLTVKRANQTYSKVAHIGSEDFQPWRCYLGRRGKLIFVFKPIMVSDYVEMEMDEATARLSLVGFEEFLKQYVGDIDQRVAQIREQIAAKQEAAKLADRHETYKDIGFGSCEKENHHENQNHRA